MHGMTALAKLDIGSLKVCTLLITHAVLILLLQLVDFFVMFEFTDDVNNGPDRNSSLSIIDLGNRIIHNPDCNKIYS